MSSSDPLADRLLHARRRPADPADPGVAGALPGSRAAAVSFADASGHFGRREIALLLGITLLGAWLRLDTLPLWSVWVDEAHTWRDATMPLDEFFGSVRRWYPGSGLLLRWLLDLGVLQQATEGWLRLPFACCGIVSVPLLALLGNVLVGSRAALLAALFLAVDPWHVYWSQNARGYVMVFFFAVLGASAFCRAIVRRSRGYHVLAVAAVLAGATFHPTTLLLLPVFVAFPQLPGLRLASRRFLLLLTGVVASVAVLPDLFALLPPFGAFLRAKPEPSLLHLAQTTAYWFRVPLLVAAGLGGWLLLQRRREANGLFLVCWAVLPLLVLALVGGWFVKATARYAIAALPAVLLLAAAGSVRIAEVVAAGLGERTRRAHLLPALALPAILCLDMAAYDYLYLTVHHGDRGRWREASQEVTAAAAGEEVEVYTTNQPSMLYYLQPNYWRTRRSGVTDPDPDAVVVSIESFEVALRRSGRDYLRNAAGLARERGRQLFVVVSLPELREKDVDGSLLATLQDEFALVTVLPCQVGPKDEGIWIYRPRTR